MTSFASYAFNKSHAAAYATISYQTAYLKCHYYKEYMASLMTNALLDSTDKLYSYITDVTSNGVKVLPVDINKSERGFTADKEGIRFALLAVKSLGEASIANIIKERENGGEFRSLWDFCSRVSGRDVSVRTVEALIKSGAFDCLGNNRREMIDACADVIACTAKARDDNLEGQLDFFGISSESSSQSLEKPIPKRDEFTRAQLIEFEHEALGMYISGHPADDYLAVAAADKCTTAQKLTEHHEACAGRDEGEPAKLVGMITSRKELKTKKGDMMCFLQIEDSTSGIELVVFPEVYRSYSDILSKGNVIFASGKVSGREDEKPKLIADRILRADAYSNACLKKDICVRLNSGDKALLENIRSLAVKNAGTPQDNAFFIYLSDVKKKIRLKDAQSIRLTRALLEKLAKLAGSDNIAFMQSPHQNSGAGQ